MVDGTRPFDVPGWNDTREVNELGPTCWKCNGKCEIKKKSGLKKCSVCAGNGRLNKKKQINLNKKRKLRVIPDSYVVPGPEPM